MACIKLYVEHRLTLFIDDKDEYAFSCEPGLDGSMTLRLFPLDSKRKKMMVNASFYSVRVLFSYPIMKEKILENLTWEQAVQRFEFYVQCCLAFPELHVRCVNIIKGKRKSIKMFSNHGY